MFYEHERNLFGNLFNAVVEGIAIGWGIGFVSIFGAYVSFLTDFAIFFADNFLVGGLNEVNLLLAYVFTYFVFLPVPTLGLFMTLCSAIFWPWKFIEWKR